MTAPTPADVSALRDLLAAAESDPGRANWEPLATAAVNALPDLLARAEAGDALRAGIEALADEWEGWAKVRSTTRIDAFRDAAEHLRALLAESEAGS